MTIWLEKYLEGSKPGQIVDLKRLPGSRSNGKDAWCADTADQRIMVQPRPELSKLGRDEYKAILTDDFKAEVILYAPLHQHSDNSLLDGMTKVSQMVNAAEYAAALTDHGNMYGFCEFYKSMREKGKKPIIGVEAYTCDMEGELANRHLILLAKNQTGYHNLLKLVSESYDHFYKHPHMTWEMLEERHEGIIACAACAGGVIQQLVLKGEVEKAKKAIERYIGIFGKENFYLEVQRHGLPEEGMVEAAFRDFAEEFGLKIIATTDAHYPTKEDAYPHEVMLCMQRSASIAQPHWKFEGEGYYLHSSDDMEQRFHDHPEWLDNTLDLADKCNLEIELGHVNLPQYDIPAPFTTSDEYFEHLCHEGFEKRFTGTPHLTEGKYKERFTYEMDMIKNMGFSGYFLIVWDYINWARNHDVYVGPGRGSAAGSLLAYCLGITDLDPIKYDLLFERFLNPERVSMPDVDVDFEHSKRELVLNYVAQKYGVENVCHIVTFGTLGAKTVIRDVARVLDCEPAFSAKLSKMVPQEVDMTLSKALEMSYDLKHAYDSDPMAKRIIDIGLRLEGCKRHSSQHACFTADTLVTTKMGKKRICNVQEGDEVLTHKGHYKPVMKTMVRKSSDIHILVFENGQRVEVTGNHPLLVATGPIDKTNTTMTYKYEWVEVKFIEVGDGICTRTPYGMGVTHVKNHIVETSMALDVYNLTVLDDSSYTANDIVAHNCGFIVAPGKVDDWLPTSMEKDESGNKAITAQVTMSEAEELGLLKMDFLGLKNMTVIHDVINAIKKTRGIDIDYHDIPMNDRATYQMLSNGLTGGVFQLESPGMTKVIRQMLSDVTTLDDGRMDECFERIIAAVALYRPGPMAYIPDYVRGVNDPTTVCYDCPEEEDILKSTYGVMVYQEQLMHIAQRLAGYSLGEADILRKACGKKKKDVMAKEHDRFVHGNKTDFDAGKAKHYVPGCMGNGVSEPVAEEIWSKMEKFASYAFNRSHAACYAYIGVITAYMACHWGAEFYAAMLNAFIENSDKLRNYLGQATKRKIKLLVPDINLSLAGFDAVSENSIRFGLRGIKGVSGIADAIIAERDANGPYCGLQDFYQRMDKAGHTPSSNVVEALIAAGAFNSDTKNKKALMQQAEKIAAQTAWRRKHLMENQVSLFGEGPDIVPLPTGVMTSGREALNMEFAHTGLYISGHPADAVRAALHRDRRLVGIMDLHEHEDETVSIVGAISGLQHIYTKKGDLMYRMVLGDQYGDVNCIVFPSRVEPNRHALLEGVIVKAVGRFETDEEYGDKFIIQDLISEQEIMSKKEPAICVSVENKSQQDQLISFVKSNPGDAKVVIKANEKLYHLNIAVALGATQLDYLQSNFREVIPM